MPWMPARALSTARITTHKSPLQPVPHRPAYHVRRRRRPTLIALSAHCLHADGVCDPLCRYATAGTSSNRHIHIAPTPSCDPGQRSPGSCTAGGQRSMTAPAHPTALVR
jgi:hypothetical protein